MEYLGGKRGSSKDEEKKVASEKGPSASPDEKRKLSDLSSESEEGKQEEERESSEDSQNTEEVISDFEQQLERYKGGAIEDFLMILHGTSSSDQMQKAIQAFKKLWEDTRKCIEEGRWQELKDDPGSLETDKVISGHSVPFLHKPSGVIIDIGPFGPFKDAKAIWADHLRQRALQDAGYKVVRFTGSDILEPKTFKPYGGGHSPAYIVCQIIKASTEPSDPQSIYRKDAKRKELPSDQEKEFSKEWQENYPDEELKQDLGFNPPDNSQGAANFMDFANLETATAFELDGTHFHKKMKNIEDDWYRDRYLLGKGWRVRRYSEIDTDKDNLSMTVKDAHTFLQAQREAKRQKVSDKN